MNPAAKMSRARPARRKLAAYQGTAQEGLLPAAELERLAERIFRLSEADETEVTIDVTCDALTRFANNTIHQNVAEQNLSLSVRTVFDGRTARATTNRTEQESLARVVAASSSIARSQPRSPNLLRMLTAQKYQRVSRYVDETASASAQERAQAVARVCREIARRKQTGAGIFSTGATQSVVSNSRGLFASHRQTRAEFSVTVLEADSSGWQKANSSDLQAIDPPALAERASEKAQQSRRPVAMSPGHYTVILEPAAVLDLVGFLFYDFAATAVADKRSCFNQRLGKQLLGANISIWDDVYHPLQSGPPFDGEGTPRQRVHLVDAGVPRNLVYARSTAKQMKAKPTGHGFPLPNEYGEAPMNLVFAGGQASLQELIASTARGVYVTRLWYIREVDPYEKILTGMTRDGTFRIEEGALAGGIRNFRFNQSVLEMLANVEMMTVPVRAAGEESFEMVVPAMKVREFHFTEATKF
jgi:PmbA protein